MAILLASAGTAVSVVTGASFALQTSGALPQTSQFAAGTVTIETIGGTGNCSFSGLLPGQSGTCTYVVEYTGTLAGWVGLNVQEQSPSQKGSPALYTGTPDGLQLSITDQYGNTYGLNQDNQLVAQTGPNNVNADGSVNAGWTDTFTVNWSFPVKASGSLKGGTADVRLLAHAVQESNDPLVGTCPTLGWSTSGVGGCSSGGTTPGGGSTTTTGATYDGYSKGFWQNKNGNALLDPSGDGNVSSPVMLGGGSRSTTVTKITVSNAIIRGDACGTVWTCKNTGAVKLHTLDQLAAQTLALAYNLQYVSGFSGETLGQFGITPSGVPGLSISTSTTMSALLGVANGLIAESTAGGTTTQAEASDMVAWLGTEINSA
jgi:hypothetical protein